MDKVAVLAESQGASLYEIIRNADLFPDLKSASAKLLKFAEDVYKRQPSYHSRKAEKRVPS